MQTTVNRPAVVTVRVTTHAPIKIVRATPSPPPPLQHPGG